MKLRIKRRDFVALFYGDLFLKSSDLVSKAIDNIAKESKFSVIDFECQPLKQALFSLINKLKAKIRKHKHNRAKFEELEANWLNENLFSSQIHRKSTGISLRFFLTVIII